MLPVARQHGLDVKEMTEETLVYDLERDKAHCLNRTSALVWKHCDGKTSVPQLVAIFEKTLGVAKPLAVVELALEQLSKRNLLMEPVAPAEGQTRLSRREMLKDLSKKLAVVAAALPLVMTIAAPTARAQGTPCTVVLNAATLRIVSQAGCTGGKLCAALSFPGLPAPVGGNITTLGVCK
jgi:hypothetical protein